MIPISPITFQILSYRSFTIKRIPRKMDEIDSIINDMMVLKEYFRAKFYDEIKIGTLYGGGELCF